MSAPGAPQRALVIGEALIDIVERDGEVIGEHVGGSPLNVAVGLARLGRGVDFLTHIGDDARGHRIVDYVEGSGAQLVSGSVTAGRTPTALATLDESGIGAVHLRHRLAAVGHTRGGAAVGGAHRVDRDHARTGLPRDGRAARRVSPLGDNHFRPERAPGADRRRRAGAQAASTASSRDADVVKASDEDLRWIDPNRTPEQVAATWLGLGPSIVAVTMGEHGAFALCEAGIVRVPARRVDVVDTVGAGDAFMTGLIDALWSLGLLGAGHRRDLAPHRHRHTDGERCRPRRCHRR